VAFLSLSTGVAITAFFGAHLLRYGMSSVALANAVSNVAAQERMREGDVEGAFDVLNLSLNSTLGTLAANESSLTSTQRAQFVEVRNRVGELH
jgi:hypothetical protein